MVDMMTLRVPRRAQHLYLSEIARMHRSALDNELPGISRALTAAIATAEQFVHPTLRRDVAEAIDLSFRRAGVKPGDWMGAVTVCYAAMLAGCCWSHIDVDTARELTERWDVTTADHWGASVERVQLREIGLAMGLGR